MSSTPRRLNPRHTCVYASWIPALQDVARRHGYALTIHGSVASDLDLFAVPWVEYPTTPEALIDGLRDAYHIVDDWQVIGPDPKPHGRRAWNVIIGGALVFDVSVVPTPDELRAEERLAELRWKRVLRRWETKHHS